MLQKSNIELTGSVLLDNFALRRDRVSMDMLALVAFTTVVLNVQVLHCCGVDIDTSGWCYVIVTTSCDWSEPTIVWAF